MSDQYKYEHFDDWFLEIENYGTRAERFYDSLENVQSELGRISNGLLWLQAAFECGRMLKEKKETSLTYQDLVDAGIIRPNERDLEGEEYTTIRRALTKITPYKTTNNQRFITEYYKMNGLEYHLTVMDGDPPDVMITEVKPKTSPQNEQPKSKGRAKQG